MGNHLNSMKSKNDLRSWNYCAGIRVADLRLVELLAFVRHHGADDLPGVLDDHLGRVDVSLAEQTAAVDRRPVTQVIVSTFSARCK